MEEEKNNNRKFSLFSCEKSSDRNVLDRGAYIQQQFSVNEMNDIKFGEFTLSNIEYLKITVSVVAHISFQRVVELHGETNQFC